MDSPKNFNQRTISVNLMDYEDDDKNDRDSFLSDQDHNNDFMRSSSDVDSAPRSN